MKIPLVGPDIEQAIEHTLRLTLFHNSIPIVLALVCLISLMYLIIKPSRVKIFILIGFSLLLLYFEYMKHIMEPLTHQTLVTLDTEAPRYRFEWFTEKMLTKGIPVLLMLGAWGSLIGSSIYFIIIKSKKKKVKH